jgi:hypothetical protein
VTPPFEEGAPWKTPYDREQAAWVRLSTTVLTGATVGGLIGGLGLGLGSAGVGCLLGGLAGATAASATIVGLFGASIPAAAVGCIGGVIAAASLGGVASQLFVTAPVVVAAVVQYFTTINSPMPSMPAMQIVGTPDSWHRVHICLGARKRSSSVLSGSAAVPATGILLLWRMVDPDEVV